MWRDALGAEVQYLCNRGIPFYLYSVEEHEELVRLAPDWVAPHPTHVHEVFHTESKYNRSRN